LSLLCAFCSPAFHAKQKFPNRPQKHQQTTNINPLTIIITITIIITTITILITILTITNPGFYYDSYMGEGGAIKEGEIKEIDAEFGKCVKEKQPFERLIVTKEEALELFAYNPFKSQLIATKVTRGGGQQKEEESKVWQKKSRM
jgi:hypothetical protein